MGQTVAVRMFGPLEVRVGDARLGPRDFGGVKPKQLLEVLLLQRRRPVSKDRIAEALWTGQLPQHVGATIEQYVSLLRLRLASEAGLGWRLIVTESGGYRLAAEEVTVDVDRYERLLQRAATSWADARRAALEAAVDLGEEELLADEPYASWIIPTREHYRERQIQALVDLGECCLDLDDYPAALAAAQRAVKLEPTRERAHRVAMLAHHGRGDRDAALRAYARCLDALAEELGVTPTAETAELHALILRERDGTGPAGSGGGLSTAPAARRPHAPIGYASNGGVQIACQTVGQGPLDLVFSPSHVSSLAATWDDPTYAAFLRRLASMARLILFDKRGTGLSDPALDFPTTSERSDDLVAVLDAVESQRAVLFGVCAGGALCVQLAADHPERVAGLILHNSMARLLACEDYPWGWAPDRYARLLAGFDQAWLGGGEGLVHRNPGLAEDPRFRAWFARYVRLGASPWMARRLSEMNAQLDVRSSLGKIQAPCLVICRTEDVWFPPESSRHLAREIAGAELVELPGVDHDPWVGDSEQVLEVVAEFLDRLGSREVAAGAAA